MYSTGEPLAAASFVGVHYRPFVDRVKIPARMIHLQFQGKVGNNLFQYVVARLLAEDFGYELEVEHSVMGGEANATTLTGLLARFEDAPLTLPGRRFSSPIDATASIDNPDFDGYRVDLEAIRSNRDNRRIDVNGFFERYELIRPVKDKVRRWFSVPHGHFDRDVTRDDVVVHVRRGDFLRGGRAISLDYYTDVLDRLDFRRLYVCGVGLDEDERVRRRFAKYSPVFVRGSAVDDFLFMKGFNRIVQSQSTFSWWAAFLSDASEIYTPALIPNFTEFDRRYSSIDLRVDDEPRYHQVERVPPDRSIIFVSDVLRARRELSSQEFHRLGSRALAAGPSRLVVAGKRLIAGAGRRIVRVLDRTLDRPVGSWLEDVIRWQVIYKRRRYSRGTFIFEEKDATRRATLPGGHERILIVRMNHSYAGFFSYFTFALNQFLFCEQNNCLPVVDFGPWSEDGPNAYHDPARGDNMWDYFFEPPAGYTYADIRELIRDPASLVSELDLYRLSNNDLWYLHGHDRRGVFGYPYGFYRLKERFDGRWYDEQRRRAHRLLRRWVRLKPDVLEAVDQFHATHMQGQPVIGVHLRGTDKGTAWASRSCQRVIEPEAYYPEIDHYLGRVPDARIFAATDQRQFLTQLRERYADRLLCTDSHGSKAPHRRSSRTDGVTRRGGRCSWTACCCPGATSS